MSSIYTKLFLKKDEGDKIFFLLAFVIVVFFSAFFVLFPVEKIRIKGKISEVEFLTLTNISPSQLSIVWKTSEPVESFILFGTSPDNLISKAEDKLYEKNKKSFYHYATLKNLNPNTEYFFGIKVKNKLIGKGDTPFKFKTPPMFTPSKKPPLISRILDENGRGLSNKIIILQIEGAFPLSTVTGEKGEFVIPLSLIFDKDGKKKIEISEKENFELRVLEESLLVRGSLEEFLNFSSPLISGREYFFKKSSESDEFVNREKIRKGNYSVILIYPQESAVISNLRPLIKGKGVPYEEVLVYIEGKKSIVLRTRVDKDGYWQADLPFRLDPDKYIIRVKTVDKEGKDVEILRDFRITKGGESVLAESTPSATLEPTPTIGPTPTFTPTPTSALAMVSPSPTSSENITPTAPVSGFDTNILLGISFLFLLPGIVLLLK